jgi:hypothetical protein
VEVVATRNPDRLQAPPRTGLAGKVKAKVVKVKAKVVFNRVF